jgi:hypothetical protein
MMKANLLKLVAELITEADHTKKKKQDRRTIR